MSPVIPSAINVLIFVAMLLVALAAGIFVVAAPHKLVGRQKSARGLLAPQTTSRCQIERDPPYPVGTER